MFLNRTLTKNGIFDPLFFAPHRFAKIMIFKEILYHMKFTWNLWRTCQYSKARRCVYTQKKHHCHQQFQVAGISVSAKPLLIDTCANMWEVQQFNICPNFRLVLFHSNYWMFTLHFCTNWIHLMYKFRLPVDLHLRSWNNGDICIIFFRRGTREFCFRG